MVLGEITKDRIRVERRKEEEEQPPHIYTDDSKTAENTEFEVSVEALNKVIRAFGREHDA